MHSPVSSVFDKSLRFRIHLLVAVLVLLLESLLTAHALDHVDDVHAGDIGLLLLRRQRPLGRLLPLLLVLLLFGGLLRIFSDGAFVSVPEKHALFLRRLVGHLDLLILVDEDRVDGLVDTLGGGLFEVLLLRITLQVEDVLEVRVVVAELQLTLALLGLLLLDIVAGEFGVEDAPVVGLIAPHSAAFDPLVLVSRNELVDDQVLHTDLACQFTDTLHEVLAFAMDDLLHIVKLTADLADLRRDLHDFLRLDVKLLLLGGKVLLQSQLLLLLLLDLLSHADLLTAPVFDLGLAAK